MFHSGPEGSRSPTKFWFLTTAHVRFIAPAAKHKVTSGYQLVPNPKKLRKGALSSKLISFEVSGDSAVTRYPNE